VVEHMDNCEARKLGDNEAKLKAALEMLFELLEAYAPTWYTEEHHDKAAAALACKRRL
jgi:hypothetical protein